MTTKRTTKRSTKRTTKKTATRRRSSAAAATADPEEAEGDDGLAGEDDDEQPAASTPEAPRDPDEQVEPELADEEDGDADATLADVELERPQVDPPRPDVELHPTRREPVTRDELLAEFGDEYLSIQSLFQFCFVPTGRLAFLRDLALEEDWGENGTVLLKYLAVNVRLAIEQGAYVWNGDQIVMTAGRLTTAAGTPLYLGLVRNQDPGQNPWVMNWVGERPSCAELPEPPRLPRWPGLSDAAEIVVAAELVDPERRVSLPALQGIGPVAQSCALVGAVHWAMRRDLAVRQLHGASRGWFVPLFLHQRDDTTDVPDGAAPVMAVGSRLVVRAVLDPHVCYPAARALVERWDQLPTWLLEAWDAAREDGADD